ncbi:MAG: MATE family efflux transporter [Clostridiales bacterium]|nr:MATE family efflux transporter [Clostridiales bacterium]
MMSEKRERLFSNEDLRRLIVPLVIDQVLVRTVGMVDTMMISSVGEAAISGVSLVDMINMLINAVFAAIATGGAVIASQYLGHRERDKACEASSQLMLVTLLSSLIITALTLLVRRPLLSVLFGQIEADVMAAALTYLTISAISFPFLAIFNSCGALFRSMNDSRTPTVVSLGMNLMNLVGNAILIFGLRMGVAGAAISTLLSRMMAALVMLALTCDRRRQLFIVPGEALRPQGMLIGQILYIGIPSGIENGLFELGRIVVVSMISTFGTVQIAANAVANNLDAIGVLAGAAMNLAILTVVGRCVGAHDNEQVRYYTRKLLVIEYAMLAAVNIVLLAALSLILNLYTLSDASRELATKLIFIHNGFAMILWPLALSLPNALRAANDVRFTMISSILSMVGFRVALSYVVGVRMGYGALGVWFAMLVDWLFRAVIYVWRFRQGKWQSMARI